MGRFVVSLIALLLAGGPIVVHAEKYGNCLPETSCRTIPMPADTADAPTNCRKGESYIKGTAGAGNCATAVNNTLCLCTADNTWLPVASAVATSPIGTALATILQSAGLLAAGTYSGAITTTGAITGASVATSPNTGTITGVLQGIKDVNNASADVTIIGRNTDSGSVSATGDLTTITLAGPVAQNRIFHVRSSGSITWTSNTQRYQVTLGTVVVCDMTAYTPANGDVYNFEATITVQTNGATATTRCAGLFSRGVAGASAGGNILVNTDATNVVLTGTPVLKTNVIIVATNALIEKQMLVTIEN